MKTLRLLLFFGLSAVLVSTAIFGKRGWLDLQRMHQSRLSVEAETREVARDLEFLNSRIQAFEADPVEQERAVREVLGYVKSDETVVIFD